MAGPKPALQSLIEGVLDEHLKETFEIQEDLAREIVLAIQRAGGIKAFMEGHHAPNLESFTLHHYYVSVGDRFDLLDTQRVISARESTVDPDRIDLTVLQKEA